MDILPAITGGFAGSLITLGLQSTIRYWNRPILVVDNDTKGSDLLPTGYLSDYEGNILKDTQGSSRYVKQHYLRLRIANLGNTFAKNVSACITSITYRRSGTDTVFDAEVFELKLALTKDRAVFDVAAKGHRCRAIYYLIS